MSNPTEAQTRLSVPCDPDFKKSLRVEAAKLGISLSEYVRRLLRSARDAGRLEAEQERQAA